MYSRIRVGLYSMMVVLLALASAFTVIPARADDGAPPPPAAPAGPSSKTVNTPSVLSNVPAGTDVVVINRSGHKLALASQQAADILVTGDPIWCPAGVAPKPGLGGCTPTQALFNSGGLLSLISGKTVNGTIWIAPGYSSAGEGPAVSFGVSLGSTVNHTLTINGGWNGISGSTILLPNSPSVFNVPLTITGWTNAVTLNDITISGTFGTGLTVATTGSIVLNNIDAVNNGAEGAFLDNSSGTTGTVTVNYSTFSNNADNGLRVYSDRPITGKNITAINNGFNGVYLNNTYSTAAQPLTLTGVNNFNSNVNYGLEVFSNAAITLGNVTADFNAGKDGVYLDNCNFDAVTTFLCLTPGSNNITLKGSNNFDNNGWDGLEVWASGALTANNLTANDNGTALGLSTVNQLGYEHGMGAYLNNFGSIAGKPLTLTGTNSFTGNGSTGLVLDSFGVTIANNVTANENGFNIHCQPAIICDGLFIPNVDPSAFTLTGYGTFNGNAGNGLYATVWGNITLTNITADLNFKKGALLDNCSLFSGACTTAGKGKITLTGTNVFSNNQDTGVYVSSPGTVTMSNVTASYNGLAHNGSDGDGLHVENCFYNFTSNLCAVTAPKSVILTGMNNFNNNYFDGLFVNASGAITAGTVTANNNTLGDGAILYNGWNVKNFNITLSGKNVFKTNGYIGLEAYSNGSIVMSNVTANENQGGISYNTSVDAGGAYLESQSTTLVPVAITLTGINTFNDNGLGSAGKGLDAYSDGNITISNLTANNNRDGGAYLNNTYYGPLLIHRNITLTGVNNFVNNATSSGLSFDATGAVSLTQVTADKNAVDGVYGIAGGALVITCGSMFQNGLRGYDIGSSTSVTLKGVFTGLNGLPDNAVPPAVVTRACPLP